MRDFVVNMPKDY